MKNCGHGLDADGREWKFTPRGGLAETVRPQFSALKAQATIVSLPIAKYQTLGQFLGICSSAAMQVPLTQEEAFDLS